MLKRKYINGICLAFRSGDIGSVVQIVHNLSSCLPLRACYIFFVSRHIFECPSISLLSDRFSYLYDRLYESKYKAKINLYDYDLVPIHPMHPTQSYVLG